MYAARPVVALASGGPMESISHGKTGFLVKGGTKGFAMAMHSLVVNPKLALEMGASGRKDAKERFSLKTFGAQIEELLQECYSRGECEKYFSRVTRVFCFLLGFTFLVFASYQLVK